MNRSANLAECSWMYLLPVFIIVSISQKTLTANTRFRVNCSFSAKNDEDQASQGRMPELRRTHGVPGGDGGGGRGASALWTADRPPPGGARRRGEHPAADCG